MPVVDQADFEPRPLSPQVWDNMDLRPAVREQMLKAAKAFIEEFDVDMRVVKDITFTGSMAGYYWLPSSDLDLHILAAFDEINDDNEILRDYYDLAKVVWGKNREQFICGHEVELYVQDVNQPHHAAGVYSVLNDDWIQMPEKFGDVNIDVGYIEYKISYLERGVKHATDLVARKPDEAMEYITKLKAKLKKMRQAGLDKAGEMSPDNLAFKSMRRAGLIDKLRDLYQQAYTLEMSLNCDR
jgi:hypothetical protein